MSTESGAPAPGAVDDPSGEDVYLTVDALTKDSRHVLDTLPQEESADNAMAPGAIDDGTVQRAREVIEKGRRTGRILDSFEERRIAQKELDYLAKTLERLGLPFQRTTLEPYSAERLQAVPVPRDPFEVLPPHEHTDALPTAESLRAYVWQHFDFVGLRSDRALWDHLTAQLAGDPEAWPLLDFTMKRLYQNLKREGSGNKIQWPAGMETNARVLLAETTRKTWEAMSKAEQEDAHKSLAVLGLDARTSLIGQTDFDADGIALPVKAGTPRALAAFVQEGVVRSVESDMGERRWRLTHRSLQERWLDLQHWTDAEEVTQRRRDITKFWSTVATRLSIAIGIGAVLAVPALVFHKHQLALANTLAGIANVRLSEIASVENTEDRRAAQNKLLLDVRKAYETGNTPLAYTTLFNAVNSISHMREYMTRQITNSFLVTFGRKSGEPTVKLTIPAQEDFVPAQIAGQPLVTAFSPDFDSLAIVFMTDEATPQHRLNVYRWGVPDPIYSDHLCAQNTAPGGARLSHAGRFFSVECTLANQVIGAVAPPDKARIDRMFDVVGLEKLVQERFPFFSGQNGRIDLITISAAGVLTVRPLDGDDDGDVVFRIPLFATTIPIAAAYDRIGKRVAVLDKGGIVAIHGKPNWLTGLFSSFDESPALVYINANDVAMDSNLTWQLIDLEFLPGGKCLRVRRMAIDHDIVAGSFLQHFWDEFFVIDADRLLDMARRLSNDEKAGGMPCRTSSTSGY